MTTSATSLLDILRGHKPAPPSPSASSPAAAPQSQQGQGQGDLNKLFQSAFSTSHPSSPAADITQGIIEQPSPPLARSPGLNGLGGAGDGDGDAGASKSLLSLLQGMGGAGGGAGASEGKQLGAQERENGQGAAGAGSKGEQARDLLATLMGGGGGGSSRPSPSVLGAEQENNHTSPPPPPQQQPQFTPFISPFDLLAQGHAAELAQAQAAQPSSSPPPATTSASNAEPTPHSQQHEHQHQEQQQGGGGRSATAIPAHLFPTPLSRPSSAGGSSDGAGGGGAHSSDGGGAPPPPAAQEQKQGGSLLAAQHLPTSTAAAGAGLSLPLPSATQSQAQAQSLSINLTLPHVDSLSSSSLTQHTPITLFSSSPLYPTPSVGRGQKLGVWARGIVYGTSKGRVRVIGREKGGRGLLKLGGGAGAGVGDLQVAPSSFAFRGAGGEAGEAEVKEKEKERVVGFTSAGAGGGGKLGVWKVAEGENGEISHTPLLLLSSPSSHTTTSEAEQGPRFPLLRFHPHFSLSITSNSTSTSSSSKSLLALAVNDGRVFILDLALAQAEEGGKREGVEGGEELLQRLGRGAQCGGTVVDLSFSPDGSAFVVLLQDGSWSIRRTEKPSQVVRAGQAPSSSPADDEDEQWTGVSFLSAGAAAKPTALLLTSTRGTLSHLIPLISPAPSPSSSSTIHLLLPASSALDPQTHFSHHAYHPPTQTLFLSSSLRGSLFAFRLAFSSSHASRVGLVEGEADSDADFLALLPFSGAGGEGEEQGVRVRHVLEVPTEGRVLDFVLDAEGTEEEEEGRMGALVLHEGGVHQVSFDLPRPSSAGEGEQGDGEQGEGVGEEGEVLGAEAPRRMSLESAIHVREEVRVTVDEADPLAGSAGGEVNGVRDQVCEPIEEETPAAVEITNANTDLAVEETEKPLDSPSLEAFLTSPTTPSSPSIPIHPPSAAAALADKPDSTIKLSGSAVNAAIRSMKKNKGSTSPATSPSTSTSRDPIANAWATGVPPSKKEKEKSRKEGNEEVLRELKKLEEGLPARIAKAVGKEMEKHAQRAEEDKLQDLAADTARQETMLKLVSTTLSRNTARLVDAAIKEQVKHQVVPAVGRIVAAAVQEQIGRGIEEGMKEALPNELEKLLYRPDLTAHLARNFSSTIAPSLERTLSTLISQTVLPNFHSSLNGAIEDCMQGVRQEMTDVRKEIVREQSGAVEELEAEVRGLRGVVGEMKGALERMEEVVKGLAAQGGRQASQQTPQQARPPAQQQQQRQVSGPAQALSPQHRQQPQQQSPYSLPPIPRAPTPPQAYEEMFTNALLPQHAPTFASLVHLINSSPPSRLDSIFPPAPELPKISPAVILSLAFRLSEVIASADGPLEEEGRKQLHWVRKCLTAMDGKSPELADFTPRILDSVITSLHARCKRLHALGDKRGMEEARTVEQYARAEQRLFSVRARETFRR